MREIEFRAFVKDKGKIFTVKQMDLEYKMIWFEEENKAKDTMRMFDQIELMRYTGFQDKNGKKIFEGDILKGITEDTGKTRYAIVKFGKYRDVNFEDSCYGFYFESEGEQFSIYNGEAEGYNLIEIIEIAGNIYDNPELIGEEV